MHYPADRGSHPAPASVSCSCLTSSLLQVLLDQLGDDVTHVPILLDRRDRQPLLQRLREHHHQPPSLIAPRRSPPTSLHYHLAHAPSSESRAAAPLDLKLPRAELSVPQLHDIPDEGQGQEVQRSAA